MNPDELFRKAATLKSLLQQNERAFAESSSWNEVWHTRQQLEDTYAKVIVIDFERALQEKTEQDLWNLCFRTPISALQNAARRGATGSQKTSAEPQALLGALLDSATGFYTRLIAAVKRRYGAPQVDAAALLGADFSESPPHVTDRVIARRGPAPDTDALGDFLHHSYVHLGDVARYRNDAAQAATWYRAAIRVSNARQGQAFNQLAILESVTTSPTSASSSVSCSALRVVYLYVRSVAASQPFTPAEQNLMNALRKCAERFVSVQFEFPALEVEQSFLLILAACLVPSSGGGSTVWWQEAAHRSTMQQLGHTFSLKLHSGALRSSVTMMCAVTLFAVLYVHTKLRTAEQRLAALQLDVATVDAHLRFMDETEIDTEKERANTKQQSLLETTRLTDASTAILQLAVRFCLALAIRVRNELETANYTESAALEALSTMLNALRFELPDLFTGSTAGAFVTGDECCALWQEVALLANRSPLSDHTDPAALPIDVELSGFTALRNYHAACGLERIANVKRCLSIDSSLDRVRGFAQWLVSARVACKPRLLVLQGTLFAADVNAAISPIRKLPLERNGTDTTKSTSTPPVGVLKRGKSKNIALQSILASGKSRTAPVSDEKQPPTPVSPASPVRPAAAEPPAQMEIPTMPQNDQDNVSTAKVTNVQPLDLKTLFTATAPIVADPTKTKLSSIPFLTDLEQCLKTYQSQFNLHGGDAQQLTITTSSFPAAKEHDSGEKWPAARGSDSSASWNTDGPLIQLFTSRTSGDSSPSPLAPSAQPWQRTPTFNATVGSNKPTPTASPSPLAGDGRWMPTQRSSFEANVGSPWRPGPSDVAGAAWSSFLPSPLERAVREAQLTDSRSPPVAAQEHQPG